MKLEENILYNEITFKLRYKQSLKLFTEKLNLDLKTFLTHYVRFQIKIVCYSSALNNYNDIYIFDVALPKSIAYFDELATQNLLKQISKSICNFHKISFVEKININFRGLQYYIFDKYNDYWTKHNNLDMKIYFNNVYNIIYSELFNEIK